MTKIIKGILGFSKLSVPEKINRSRSIVSAINDNPGAFAAPAPSTAVVTAAIDALEQAWNDAVNGGKDRTTAMHDKETMLMKLMYDLTAYVVAVANGDESIVHLANIETKKPSIPAKISFLVEHGPDSGTVVIRVKAAQGATYTWQYSPDPVTGTSWVQAEKNMLSKVLIKGLTPGTKYWFRVNIFDRLGDHGFNEPASLIVT